MKKLRFSVAFALALAIIATSFGTYAFAKKKANGELVLATFSDPIDLNPALSSDSASSDVLTYVFDGLLNRDENLKLVPQMAAEMPTISKDNKTITFKLRKDIKWHDGKPFTSADVKFSYEFILNKKTASPRYNNFDSIDTITAPDPYTVVFNLKKPDSALLPNFVYYYIIPKHIWENVDPTKAKQSEYNKKPVGNGPFKFVEWRSAERVVLEANPDYYGKKPVVKKIIFNITPSQAVGMVKLETGEVDVMSIPESDIARMKTKSTLNVFTYDRAAFDCILYNTKTTFFSDKRVRQAISYAVNKTAMVNGIFKGLAKPAVGSYHPRFATYNSKVKPYTYDVNKAKQLLDAAGWKVGKGGIRYKDGKPFKFVLLTNKGNIMREKLTVVVQQQLKAVGIDVEPRIYEWNTFLTKYINVGKFDAYIGGFSTGLDGDQTTFYHSDPAKGSLNKGKYSNKRVDQILEDAKLTFDLNEQKKLYGELQTIVSDEAPMTFLVYRINGLGVNKRCIGAKVTPLLGTNRGEIYWTIN